MRKGILAAAAVAALALGTTTAHADTFKYTFCPIDADCNADLTEASLIFETIDGTVDVNDYTLTVRFSGTLTDRFIDTIDFTAGLEFAALPSLTTAPTGTVLGDWTTKYDKTNAAAGNNCNGEITNHLFACSKATTGNGPSLAGTNDWVFLVNFLGSTELDANTSVDLRALFVDASGRKVDLLSPVTHTFDTTGQMETTGSVPEPAMLGLFGVALSLGARRLRARR